MLTLITLGDSILDCGHFNDRGVDPGGLLVRNDDAMFPGFAGRDLTSIGPARLEHRAIDGSTLADLQEQIEAAPIAETAILILTIGGNDLMLNLLSDPGHGIAAFARRLDELLGVIAARPIIVGTVYDPTFGDDALDFTGIDPAMGRANLHRLNEVLREIGSRFGGVADLHTHFLTGDASWFTRTIEPSLVGASEVRRCFLPHVLDAARALSRPGPANR